MTWKYCLLPGTVLSRGWLQLSVVVSSDVVPIGRLVVSIMDLFEGGGRFLPTGEKTLTNAKS